MARYRKYPVLEADLEAVRNNAEVMCRFCGERGISVAGVTKFSDGDLKIAKAYHDGGCSQIASSRTVQLKKIKKAMPEIETMLIRIPMISEAEERRIGIAPVSPIILVTPSGPAVLARF